MKKDDGCEGEEKGKVGSSPSLPTNPFTTPQLLSLSVITEFPHFSSKTFSLFFFFLLFFSLCVGVNIANNWWKKRRGYLCIMEWEAVVYIRFFCGCQTHFYSYIPIYIYVKPYSSVIQSSKDSPKMIKTT